MGQVAYLVVREMVETQEVLNKATQEADIGEEVGVGEEAGVGEGTNWKRMHFDLESLSHQYCDFL